MIVTVNHDSSHPSITRFDLYTIWGVEQQHWLVSTGKVQRRTKWPVLQVQHNSILNFNFCISITLKPLRNQLTTETIWLVDVFITPPPPQESVTMKCYRLKILFWTGVFRPLLWLHNSLLFRAFCGFKAITTQLPNNIGGWVWVIFFSRWPNDFNIEASHLSFLTQPYTKDI